MTTGRRDGAGGRGRRSNWTTRPTGSGPQAWISHAGHADYYTTFARTSDDRGRGISFHRPGDAPGQSCGAPRRRWPALRHRAQVIYEDVPVDAATDRRRGSGYADRLAAPRRRATSGSPLPQRDWHSRRSTSPRRRMPRARAVRSGDRVSNQGLAFLITDLEAAVLGARARHTSSRRALGRRQALRRSGRREAAAPTDAAMRVTTDAIQVLGGAGVHPGLSCRALFPGAKVTQIFEGTNQINGWSSVRHALG